MKKARFIFLAALVLMAFTAFKGNPDGPEKDVQSYYHQSEVADSLRIR